MKIKVEKVPLEACGVCGKMSDIPGVRFSWCDECKPKMLKCIDDYWKAKGANYVPTGTRPT